MARATRPLTEPPGGTIGSLWCRGRRTGDTSNAVQGTAATFGLGALIGRAQPVFEAIKWAGVAYLAFLGAHAIRSAVRGRYQPLAAGESAAWGRWIVDMATCWSKTGFVMYG